MSKRKPQISVKSLADGEIELSIYGPIGDGWWDDGAVSAKDVANLLHDHGDASQITLRINSVGGDAFDGSAIYSLLSQHKARVVVHIDGVAASAGATIAMAGDEIHISEAGLFMIHEAWGVALGSAADMRSTADSLERINTAIGAVYAARSGKSSEEVADLMAKETWFTGAEAVEAGFADHLTEAKRVAAACKPKWAERYRNAPERLFNVQPIYPVLNGWSGGATSASDSFIYTDAGASANRPATATDPSERLDMGKIHQALNLPEDADETAVVAAIGGLQSRASLATELEGVIGAKGPEALGAVRAMSEKAEKADKLKSKLDEVEGAKVAGEFATLLKGAQEGDEKKLTPAMATHWQEQFDKAEPRAKADKVDELRGYLKVASPVVPANVAQPKGATGSASSLVYNGKAYDDLSYAERAQLLKDEPELGRQMKDDFDRRQGR